MGKIQWILHESLYITIIKEVGEKDKKQDFAKHLICLSQEAYNKFNNTGAFSPVKDSPMI